MNLLWCGFAKVNSEVPIEIWMTQCPINFRYKLFSNTEFCENKINVMKFLI